MSRLGHIFQDRDLFKQALTHRSASGHNNERLEFLGDSVLNLIISQYLYERFPNRSEGDWTRLRASLVCESSLVGVAETFDLGHYLILGSGEQRSGGAYRASIMADALEALIGALYLELGFVGCKPVILPWFQKSLNDLDATGKSIKDAKTQLQEALQAEQLALPIYALVGTYGSAHDPQFRLSCELPDLGIKTVGQATTRKRAEQAAAEAALAALIALKQQLKTTKNDTDIAEE